MLCSRALFAWAWFLHSSSAYFLEPPGSFEEAVEQIAALRKLITELKTALQACTLMTRGLRGTSVPSEEGRHLDEVTSVVRGDSNWHVDDGACLLEDGCIASPNFPEHYDAGQRCDTTMSSNWTGVLDLRELTAPPTLTRTRSRIRVCREPCRLEISCGRHRHIPGRGSWQLCRSTDENLTMKPKDEVLWTLTEGFCNVDVGGCVVSPNFPSAHDSQDSCTVVVDEAWLGSLAVRHLDTEHEQDVLYVNQHPVSGNYYFGCTLLHL